MVDYKAKDYLEVLSTEENSLGRLVDAFLNSPTFITDWINEEAQNYISAPDCYSFDSTISDEIAEIQNQKVRPFRVLEIELCNFRGVRDKQQLDFSSDITIVTGEGSTGKTTLAEAFEWILVGELSRYNSSLTGETSELKDCIRNQQSSSDETYVEIKIETVGEVYTLKRILLEDYSGKQHAVCKSKLFQNGKEIEEEDSILSELIITKPPILLQHSIGDFIRQRPSERAKYFESLLGIESISNLIKELVINDDLLNNIKNPVTNNKYIDIINNATRYKPASQLKILLNTNSEKNYNYSEILLSELTSIDKFSLIDVTEDYEVILEKVKKIIKDSILQELPRETIIPQAEISLYTSEKINNNENLFKLLSDLNSLEINYFAIKDSLKLIDEQSKILYKAIIELQNKGLLDANKEIQNCPLCNTPNALSNKRIESILSSTHIQRQIDALEKTYIEILSSLNSDIKSDLKDLKILLPKSNNYKVNYEYDYKDKSIKNLVINLTTSLEKAWTAFDEFQILVTGLIELINSLIENRNMDDLKHLITNFSSYDKLKNVVFIKIQDFHKKYTNLNTYLNKKSLSNEESLYINNILELLENEDLLVRDITWYQAKYKISELLKTHRETLKQFRTKIFKSKESFLNEGLTKIWSLFRPEDLNQTTFSKVNLPEPYGRGFYAKIEVIADVKNLDSVAEVSALSVFTESQINLLGLAAFMTKFNIEGAQTYILDDPMQSMNEDHMEKFAQEFIKYVENEKKQLIVFTHSNTFGKEISNIKQFAPNIKEYRASCTKRKGSFYSNSDSYIINNLQSIYNNIEDGRPEQIRSACSDMRSKVLEKLFKYIAVEKNGKSRSSVHNATIEYLLKEGGVRDFFNNELPEIADQMNDLCDFLNNSNGPHDANERTPQVLLSRYIFLQELVEQVKNKIIGD